MILPGLCSNTEICDQALAHYPAVEINTYKRMHQNTGSQNINPFEVHAAV